MKILQRMLLLWSLGVWIAACSPSLPTQYKELSHPPYIYPDYIGTTLPCNIAPISFYWATPNGELSPHHIARVMAHGKQYILEGDTHISFPQGIWDEILNSCRGDSVAVDLYHLDESTGEYLKNQTFHFHIADSEIDEYISYRLIEPAYTVFGDMCLAQRDITCYDESVIYSTKPAGNQCVNCHSYQNYGTQNMLYHKRANEGGTVIRIDGKDHIVNLKRENTISAGVYPSWHPTESLIAFSTNKTHQLFHSANPNKVEVYDTESDLILYDPIADQVNVIADGKETLEVFPTWSPDGKYLYYCSAHVTDGVFYGEHLQHADSIRYSIMRRRFDIQSRTFGPEEMVYAAADSGLSATLPRINPDGQKMVFAEAPYGCFHIWHRDSKIRIMDLSTGILDTLGDINNGKTAPRSYPSFSSNGKWIMYAARLDDCNYSRIYISYYDGNKTYKPFMLPQASPYHNTMRLKSYNRPEFMKEKVD